MLCVVLSIPLVIPGLQLGEVNGCVLVDSEGLTMLISLCCTEWLISVAWPSLSLKNEQKNGAFLVVSAPGWFYVYPVFCIAGHQLEISKIKAAQNESECLSVCSDLPSCHQAGMPRMNPLLQLVQPATDLNGIKWLS